MGEHGENSTVCRPVGIETELGEDSAGVGLHRTGRNPQALGDLLVRVALCHQAEYHPLLCGQAGQGFGIAGGLEDLAYHVGVDGRPARR